LDAARQNSRFLTAAGAALAAVRKDLELESPQFEATPAVPTDQQNMDAGLAAFKFGDGDGVDSETGQELQEARKFYQAVSKGAENGLDAAALSQRLSRRVSGWQARNRRHLITADSALRKLELSAVSGLASVVNYGLSQESTNLSPVIFPIEPAPDLSSGVGTLSPSGGKVSLKDVLNNR
jgi:hypothetical protein